MLRSVPGARRLEPSHLSDKIRKNPRAGFFVSMPNDQEELNPSGEAAVQEEVSPESKEAAEPEKPLSDLDAARAERDQVIAENRELLDRFQRAQAEFENIRKRLERERQELRDYSAMETIESLLPIVDDFERAASAEAVDPEVAKGLQMIQQRILDVFERAGLQEIEDGGKFDPHLHQAVDRASVETDEEDQDVLDTYQKGYKFKDRLLRAAMVKVAVKE